MKPLHQQIANFKKYIEKRQQISSTDKFTQSSMSSILLAEHKKNPSQHIRQFLQQTQIIPQTLFSLALNIKSISLIPHEKQIQTCQDCINWAKAIAKQNKFYDILISKTFTIGRVLDQKYIMQLKIFRTQEQNVYEKKRKKFITLTDNIIQRVNNMHGTSFSLDSNILWLLEQKLQYIQKMVNQVLISLTMTKGKKFEAYCVSHNIFQPLLQRIYQIQIQIQGFTLQVIQQHYKIALTRIIMKHQIFFLKCVIMSLAKGLIFIGNETQIKYNSQRDLNYNIGNENQININHDDPGPLIRDLYQQYKVIVQVLQKSIQEYKKKLFDQISSFLKITGQTGYSKQLVQIQKQVVSFFQSQFKQNPPSAPLTKTTTTTERVLNYMSSKISQITMGFDRKDNHLALLKNKLTNEKMKSFVERTGLLMKNAAQQINLIMQKKINLYKSKKQNQIRMNAIQSYVQGILIHVVDPIKTSKQQVKLNYLLVENKKKMLNSRKPTSQQQYGIVYLANVQSVNNMIKNFCKIYEINIRQIVLSDYFNSPYIEQFRQIGLLYKQTQFYQHMQSKISMHTIRYNDNLVMSNFSQYAQYQTPSAFTIMQMLMQDSTQLSTIFGQHSNQIFSIIYKVQKMKIPQPLRTTIIAKEILMYIIPLVSSKNGGNVAVDLKRYQQFALQILNIYKNQKLTKKISSKTDAIAQKGFQTGDYWKYNNVKLTKNQQNEIQILINNVQQKFRFLSSMQDQQRFSQYRQLARKLQTIKQIQNTNNKIQYYKKQIQRSGILNQNMNQYQLNKMQKLNKKYQSQLKKRQELYSKAQIKSIQELKQKNQMLLNDVKNQKQKLLANEKHRSQLQDQIKELKFSIQKQKARQKIKQTQTINHNKMIGDKINSSMQREFSQQQINETLANIKNKFQILPTQIIQFIFRSGFNFDDGIQRYFKMLKGDDKQQIQKFITDYVMKIRQKNATFPIQAKLTTDVNMNKQLMKQLFQFISKTIRQSKIYPQFLRMRRKQLLLQIQLHNLRLQLQSQTQSTVKMKISSLIEQTNTQLESIHNFNKQIFDCVEQLISDIKFNWNIQNVQQIKMQQNDIFKQKIANFLNNNFKNNTKIGQHHSAVKGIQAKFFLNLQQIRKQIISHPESQIFGLIYKKLQSVPQILSDIVSGNQDQRSLISLLQAAHRLHQVSMKQFQKVNKIHTTQIDLIKCLTQKYYQKSVGVMKVLYLMHTFQLIISTNANPQLQQVFDNIKEFISYPQKQIFNSEFDDITQCYQNYPIYIGIQRLNSLIKKSLMQKNLNPFMKQKINKLKNELTVKVQQFKRMAQNILQQ